MKPCTKCGQLHPPKLPCHLANASQDATIVNSDPEAPQTIQNFNAPQEEAPPPLVQNDTAQTLFQPETKPSTPAATKNKKNSPKASPTPVKQQTKAAYQIPTKSAPKNTPAPSPSQPTPQANITKIAAGVEINGYILEELLGHGGMGEVWRAIQPTIKRKVAIKILDARLATDQSLVARFLREAQTVNEIHHRNLVDIYGFGQLPGIQRPYLIMEYLEGRTLHHYLQERGPMPLLEIELILEQICEAIGAAHQHGIIHRDLKPENIFLIGQKSERFFVKVLDFGVAKARQSEEQQLTQTGEVFGTAEYMSPEQCMGAKQVDLRSDLYALGIILFEMISNRTPFAEDGDKPSHIWMKHVSQDPPAVTSFVDGRALPPGIDKMLYKALAKEPKDRYQSAADLFEAFQKTIHNNSQQAAPAKPSVSPIKSKEAPKSRRDSDPPKAAFLAPGQAPPDLAALKAAANQLKNAEAPATIMQASPPPGMLQADKANSDMLLPKPKKGLNIFYLGLGIGTALVAAFLIFRLFAGGASPEAPTPPPISPKQTNVIPAVAKTVATSLSTQPIVTQPIIQPSPNVKPQLALPKPTTPSKQEPKAIEPTKGPGVPEETDQIKETTLNPFNKKP